MSNPSSTNRPRRAIVILCVTIASLLGATIEPVFAQDTSQVVVPAGEPVVFRGDTLFRIYGTIGPFTPRERAAALAYRLDSLANAPLARAGSVALVDTSGATTRQAINSETLAGSQQDSTIFRRSLRMRLEAS